MMVNIFRLEHFNGRGPWSNGTIFEVTEKHGGYEKHNYGCLKKHPTPIEEGLFKGENSPEKFHCGCQTLNSLFNWFPKVQMIDYEEREFSISVYECSLDDVRFGFKQVIFRRDRSKLLEKIKPTSWKKLLKYENN